MDPLGGLVVSYGISRFQPADHSGFGPHRVKTGLDGVGGIDIFK
jgi:hypothetical protein